PRSTEAALHRPCLDKSLLDGMKPAILAQALHGAHVALVRLRCEDQTATDQRTIQPYGTRSALALLARVLRAVEMQGITQQAEQAGAWPDFGFAPLAIDLYPHNHDGILRSLSAQVIARRARTLHPCRR